ncbi:DUF4062 domain-containing protein [Candidatus Palauibacter sp.]|uniref:DUF4062 domain-containing protein n=1 Tax=Candidatus Palauibacter sp. TaxID=3101350 RepID=UPI003AF302DF
MDVRNSGRHDIRLRVFVSSVMEDYGDYREAARLGIQQVGCDPVLAEDFAAQAISPRNACLDGVQSSDALVVLLGARYGWRAPSGRSATEEEYEEARRRHLPILVFVQDGAVREPPQEEFVRRVEDYIGGHFRKSFQDANDLRRLVSEAVVAADFGKAPGPQIGAEARIRAALDRKPENTQSSVWMKTCWATPRDEEVVDPVDLDDGALQQRLQRLAHNCDPPLLNYELGKKTEATLARLRILQGEVQGSMPDEHATLGTIHSDGTLTVAQNVTGPSSRDPNRILVRMHRLDPVVVRDRLERSWSFAAAWWNDHDRLRRHDPLLYGVGFYDVGTRSFERVADHGSGGLTIPPECPENPLIVFNPRRVSRAVLNEPEPEVARIIKSVELRFREWASNVW